MDSTIQELLKQILAAPSTILVAALIFVGVKMLVSFLNELFKLLRTLALSVKYIVLKMPQDIIAIFKWVFKTTIKALKIIFFPVIWVVTLPERKARQKELEGSIFNVIPI